MLNLFIETVKKVIRTEEIFYPWSFGYSNRSCVSKIFLPTTKNTSSTKENEQDGKSHRLMIRAGLIRQSSSGVYSLLPLALRSLNKIEKIIDLEMTNIGAQKLSLPNLLSANAWKRTGRWESAGSELFRLKDRKESEFCLAPTHEEEITLLVGHEVASYRQLPLRLYQLGRKYRDEMRPRYGLLRGREFIMKDLYTFDVSEEDALRTYEEVSIAYKKIFEKIGVPFVIADADSGNIGGTKSHEFHFLSPVGEDLILTCPHCGYSANEERAHGLVSPTKQISSHVNQKQTVNFGIGKNNRLIISILEFGRVLNVSKLKAANSENFEIIPIRNDNVDIKDILNNNNFEAVDIYVDNTFQTNSSDLKSNQLFNKIISEIQSIVKHPTSIHHGDFHNTSPGDECPVCSITSVLNHSESLYPLFGHRAIEVGHTFLLGTKYSEPLKATFAPENVGELRPIQMGCYGLGISRILAAIIETSHDEYGIIWPSSVAPYKVCIIPSSDEPTIQESTRNLFDLLTSTSHELNGEILIDDRTNLSLGYRIKDSELVGYPWMMILGRRFLDSGRVEVHERKTRQRIDLKFDEIGNFLLKSHDVDLC
ncbi:14893_t:CDS:2 [Funneliformis mosseae]|uniref:proline--tRNA ligase n=1 Tax=Funneliformis mosseae TaxID=27381 RepID=A0A9N9AUL7_FUNMO|nr:14893_t:CDS:2 [Funneliformis mosseae]